MFGLRKKLNKQIAHEKELHQEFILLRSDMTKFRNVYHLMMRYKQTIIHLKRYAFEQPDTALKQEISVRLEDSYSPLFQSATLTYHFKDAHHVERLVLNDDAFKDLPTHHNLKLVQKIMPKVLNRRNYNATNYWLNSIYHYRHGMGDMRIKVADGNSDNTKIKHYRPKHN